MQIVNSRTLAVILNHNLPEVTNWLYYTLKPHQNELFDLIVIDNGSRPDLIPRYAQVRLQENLYWGGALNVAFQMVLDNPMYDSLLFLNNDIDLTPEIFVRTLRDELFIQDFVLVSPCIAGRAAPWKQMQNWGSRETRIVKWIDMQAPLFHRKLIEKIGQFPAELYYGWGPELICFDICQEMKWRTGVCDHVSIIHTGKQTIKQSRLFVKNSDGEDIPVTLQDANAKALSEYQSYFQRNPLQYGSFEELRDYGKTYAFASHDSVDGARKEPSKSFLKRALISIYEQVRPIF